MSLKTAPATAGMLKATSLMKTLALRIRVAGVLQAGDQFALFRGGTPLGNFASVVGDAGAGNAFSFDPTTGLLQVVPSVPSAPTNITWSASGGTLTLSWPGDYLGWLAQSNSVNVGDTAAWHDIPGSGESTDLTIPLNETQTPVFYRLRRP